MTLKTTQANADRPATDRPRFRDPELPLEVRIECLLRLLTRAEKISLLHSFAPAIPRLDIAAFDDRPEVLHGVSRPGVATVFPQPIGLAATWDPELVRRVGSAVGDEVRGLHHRDPRVGLNVWSPVVNLLRDPRWGRNEEGYSEDPVLTTAMGTAYCRGLSGMDDGHGERLKTAPTLKHFVAYGHEEGAGQRSVSIRPRVLREYDLRPFEEPIRTGVAPALMLAANSVNGRPNHVSPYINAIVRQWDDRIAVVSDAWAPTYLVFDGHYPDRTSAYVAALRAGLDTIVDQDDDPTVPTRCVAEALDAGHITEEDVDRSVARNLRIRFLVGEFDPPGHDPYARTTDAVVDCQAHRALAAEAARQCVVLLKNAGGLLPLDPAGTGRVAVIGPSADRIYRDWYSASTLPYEVTPLAAITDRLGDRVHFVEGVDRIALRSLRDGRYLSAPGGKGAPLAFGATEVGPHETFDLFDWGESVYSVRARSNRRFVTLRRDHSLTNTAEVPRGWVVWETFTFEPYGDGWLLRFTATGTYLSVDGPHATVAATATSPHDAVVLARELLVSGAAEAADAARDADAAIVMVGTHPMINARETQNRRDIGLPETQDALVRAVHAANADTVVVVISGYPIAATWAADNVPALMWSCHAGQELGPAVAGAIVGEYSPSGRLPQTWPRTVADLGSITDYDIIKARKTYLYSDREPLYAFGHGLSYTTFRHTLRARRHRFCADDTVELRVTVTNVGSVAADEVVQVYWRRCDADRPRPLIALCRFARVRLHPGETAVVDFAIPLSELAFWDVDRGRFEVDPGRYDLLLATSARDVVDTQSIVVYGPPLGPRSLGPAMVRAVDFDDYHDVEIFDDTGDRPDAVRAARPGAWLAYRDAELSCGQTSFATLARFTGEGWAAVEIRLDDPVHGPLLGVAAVVAGPDPGEWVSVTAPLRVPDGRRDLYLVCTDRLYLSSFRLAAEPDAASPWKPPPTEVRR